MEDFKHSVFALNSWSTKSVVKFGSLRFVSVWSISLRSPSHSVALATNNITSNARHAKFRIIVFGLVSAENPPKKKKKRVPIKIKLLDIAPTGAWWTVSLSCHTLHGCDVRIGSVFGNEISVTWAKKGWSKKSSCRWAMRPWDAKMHPTCKTCKLGSLCFGIIQECNASTNTTHPLNRALSSLMWSSFGTWAIPRLNMCFWPLPLCTRSFCQENLEEINQRETQTMWWMCDAWIFPF